MNTRTDTINALAQSNADFLAAAKKYPIEKRRDKPNAKAFSATEVLYHMIDVEKLWQRRLQRLISGESREFIAMDPDKEAVEQAYNSRDYDEGLEDLAELRQRSIELFRGMQDEQFELTGMHTRYGEMSVDRIMEIMTNHDAQHARQLERTEKELLALA
ncbi:MAG TPA: DinB family protein [Candidatus Kapabacteria bacterium]|nr:DinB family protein [Candidatus Kapabacteria bacterium]